MTAQLAPLGVQKFFDNNGNPLALGLVYTYQAGTNNPQATYKDSTQTTQNTNPIQLNARGEAPIWLDPTLGYKINITDQAGNQIPGWPVDNIPGGFGSLPISVSLIPNPTNTFTLGDPTHSWKQLYLGPNAIPAYQSNGDIIGYIGRTAAEIAASVAPTNFVYPPGDYRRYGAKLDGTTDDSTAFASAVSQANSGGAPIYIPSSASGSKIVTGTSATAPITMYGDRQGASFFVTSADITILSFNLGASGSRISDVKFVGKGSGATLPGLLFTNSNNNYLTRVGVQSFGVGVRFATGANSCYDNTLEGCRIISNISINIDGQANTNALLLLGTTFGGSPAPIGLSLIDSNSLTVIGGDVESCSTCAIDLNATSTLAAGHIIKGLHIEGNTSTAGDIRIGSTASVNGVSIEGAFYPGSGSIAGVNAVNCSGLFVRYMLGAGYTSVPFLMATNLTNEDVAPISPVTSGLSYKQNDAKFNYADQSIIGYTAPTSFDSAYQDSTKYTQYRIRSGSVAANKNYYAGFDAIEMTSSTSPGSGAKLYARGMVGANDFGGTTKVGAAFMNGDVDGINGAWSFGQSASAPAIAGSATITTAGVTVARVAPATSVTGIILQAGTQPGQKVVVVNESAAANTVTFAAAGTSHVADGTSSVIAGLNCRAFYWDTSTALWYPSK